MYSVHDICDLIILQLKSDEDFPLSNLKLQKLLYYSQSWYLAFFNKPLFDGNFQAWVHGPVNREIYERFNKKKYLYSDVRIDDVVNRDAHEMVKPNDRLHVKTVLEAYAKFSGTQLESMTHSELPWLNARKGYETNERCEVVINNDIIKAYYKKRLG